MGQNLVLGLSWDIDGVDVVIELGPQVTFALHRLGDSKALWTVGEVLIEPPPIFGGEFLFE